MNVHKYILVALCAWPAGLAGQAAQFNASVRVRSETWHWFGSDERGTYTFHALLARASMKQQHASFGWMAEVAAPVLLGLPDDAAAAAPQGQLGLGASYWVANDSSTNVGGFFLKQAFLRFGKAAGKGGSAVRMGRFEFIDGAETAQQDASLAALKRDRIAHRLIGNFGFSHAQRSFDGIHYTHDGSRGNLTAAALRPTQGVFETNGWPELNVNLAYAAWTSAPRKESRQEWRVFGVYYDDARSSPVPLKADNRPLAARQADADPVRLATIGAHYIGVTQVGGGVIDWLAWGALQTGSWGVQNHAAHAFALEAGVQPKMRAKPWLRAGYARSSGDAAAADDKHGTFFQVLPTPRPYARFPFFNAMNLSDGFVSLAFTPSPRWSLRADAHRLALSEAADGWYSGGGAFDARTFGFAMRPSNGESRLATLIDASVQLRISKQLAANAYAGRAHGGPVIDRIYPAGSRGFLAYAEVEWRR